MHTWVEVNKKAIEYNIKQFRKLVGKNILLMPIIKSNAYGHGFFEIAKICDKSKEVNRIGVVSDDEALELKTKKPIMILSFYELDEKKLLKLAKNNVIFPLYDPKQVKILNRVGERLNKKIKVHLKIDIGTSRIGILPKNIIDFVNKVNKLKFINIEGIFGHFAATEKNRGEYTKKQLDLFNEITKRIEEAGIKIKFKHTTCSAAAVLYKNSCFNLVRFGLGLYGLHSSEKTIDKINFKPALSWNTKVIQVKEVPAGTKVGYGCAFTAKSSIKIATLPVGYWDGYDRGFSNNAFVLIKGRRCPVVGRISMNLTTVDASEVGSLEIGDKATLIGINGKEKLTADDLANWIGTINYEIVDRINPSLFRKIV
jgi:alanine racemase